MPRNATQRVERQEWADFVALSGAEGQRWVEAYRSRDCKELIDWTNRSLALLRRREIEAGGKLLATVEVRRHDLAEAIPSLRPALDRLYHSAAAYYFYCIGSSDQAQEALSLAHEAVEAAIEWREFLLPLANHCYDFCLQRARIFRNDRRWREMEDYIEAGRAMLDNRLPLCVLADGRPIYVKTVDEFYRSIPVTGEADLACLEEILDEGRRRQVFELLADSTYAPPWLVIPYP